MTASFVRPNVTRRRVGIPTLYQFQALCLPLKDILETRPLHLYPKSRRQSLWMTFALKTLLFLKCRSLLSKSTHLLIYAMHLATPSSSLEIRTISKDKSILVANLLSAFIVATADVEGPRYQKHYLQAIDNDGF